MILEALGRFAYARRTPILVLGGAFLVASAIAAPGLFPHLSNGGYDNPASESSRASQLLDSELGGTESALVVYLAAPEGQTVESPAFIAHAKSVMQKLAQTPGVAGVNDYFSTGAEQFLAPNRKSLYALAPLKAGTDHREVVHGLRTSLPEPGVDVKVGGAPAVDADVLDQVAKDLKLAEAVTIPVTAVLLLLVFGGVVSALLPLAMGGLAILGTFLLLRLLVMVTPISVFAVNVVSMLGLGLAIDYSLFIVSRFREELAAGRTTEEALARTLATAGHTVFFSGLTVTLSLASLLLFPQMLLRSMGLGGAIGVIVAMGAAMTVLPAALAVLGPRVNALAVSRRARVVVGEPEARGFWFRLSHYVMQRPVTVLVLTLIPLLIAGLPFLKVRFSMPDERNLPKGVESRVVAEQLRAQFPEEELAPIQILVRFKDGVVASNEKLDALFDYGETLKKEAGIVKVVSLASLDPRFSTKADVHKFLRMANSGDFPEGKMALDHLSHGGDTLVQAYFRGDPHGDAARALVRRIRTGVPPAGASISVGGTTAQLVDLLHDMAHAAPRALAVIVAAIFVLLFVMLGSVIVPLKAVVLNFLSLTVTFGSLVFVFQEGHLAHLLGAEKLGSIDALQPMLVFVIAFGLSMDYEVFLLSRIKESFDETGDNTAAVALGIQRTGGIITSAAALLAVVIVGFAAGKVLSLKQVGLGLLCAVLVDATLVRSLLVPATMRLMGRLNWWAPKPLRQLHAFFHPKR